MDWRRLPPLAALRAFAAFNEAGGVQPAADALGVSHAAVSQQLRALEEHLGLSLLDRSGRALSLTPDGALLAEALREGFGRIGQAVQDLVGAEAARPLRITTTSAFAANWLMPRLARFREAHPQIDLVIEPIPARVEPAPGAVDLAIRYGGGTWRGLDSELLVHAPIIGVAAPELVGPAPPENLAALAQYTWFEELGTHEGSNWLAGQGLRSARGIVTLPGNLALDAARAGEGITITARVSVEADLAAGRLVALFEGDSAQGYWLVTRPGVMRAPLRRFVAWLRREAGSTPAPLLREA